MQKGRIWGRGRRAERAGWVTARRRSHWGRLGTPCGRGIGPELGRMEGSDGGSLGEGMACEEGASIRL